MIGLLRPLPALAQPPVVLEEPVRWPDWLVIVVGRSSRPREKLAVSVSVLTAHPRRRTRPQPPGGWR